MSEGSPPDSPVRRPGRSRLANLTLFLLAANLTYWPFPPHDAHWLAWFMLVPYFALLDRLPRLRHQLLVTAAYVSWGYAVAYFWVAGTMQEFAGMPLVPAFLVLLAFCLLGSTTLVPFIVLRRWWLLPGRDARRLGARPAGSAPGAILVIAGLWLAMEGWWPRLFPWYLGLTQHSVPLTRQLAELAGITAISLPVILVNLLLFEGGRLVGARVRPSRSQVLELAAAAAIVAACLSYAGWRLGQERALAASATPALRVALIQGNVGNDEKVESEGGGAAAEGVIERYGRLTTEAARERPDLVVWPETAFPWFVSLEAQDPAEVATWSREERAGLAAWRSQLAWLQRTAAGSRAALVVGGNEAEGRPRAHGGARNYNAALALDAGGALGSYRKNVLIPFGEAVPWPLDVLFPPLVPWMQAQMPRRFVLSAGEKNTPLEIRGHRVAICICYEAVLDGYIRRMVTEGDAELLLNVTNDSWFGDTGEPAQHLALASLRAVELRIPFLRVTNTGITCYVDPSGAVHDPTPLFRPATRIYDVALHPRTGQTPFARHGRWPLDLLSGLCIAVILWRRWRQ